MEEIARGNRNIETEIPENACEKDRPKKIGKGCGGEAGSISERTRGSIRVYETSSALCNEKVKNHQ
jgi:hypothetical protein